MRSQTLRSSNSPSRHHGDDGAPFYLIHTGLKDDAVEMDICGVQKANRLALADAFEAAERHHLEERMGGAESEVDNDPAPPEPESVEFDQEGAEYWETVVNLDAVDSEPQIAIRRAPALDHPTLSTYVLEQRESFGRWEERVTIGTFWGHHGGAFAMQIRDALETLGE